MHKGCPNFMRRALAASLVAGLAGVTLPARAADLLDSVRARGTLRIGLEGAYPPFNFRDTGTGQLAGYDVDVAQLVCVRLGVRPEFVTVEWAAILAELAAGRVDAVVSQVGITPRRARAFDFSHPYTYSAPQLIVRKNDGVNYRSLADLKGRRLGVGEGSVYEQQARAVPGIDVKRYPAAAEDLQDLAFGRIDAVLNDSLMAACLLKTSSLPLRAGARVGEVTRMGIALRKGNPKLRAAIDKALDAARADGSLTAASTRWFGTDASRAP